MVKIFVASFNRASSGAISKLVQKMKDNSLWTNNYKTADYILAVGDREETFDFVLQRYRENIPIIHLWAGEISQGTHDEVYRHAMTLMSCMQLCTNERAAYRVMQLCRATDKKHNIHVVGNVMLDNLDIDESIVPSYKYYLILYNPVTIGSASDVTRDVDEILNYLNGTKYFWLPPNGEKYSSIIMKYVNTPNLERPKFLGLLKHCEKFITNSSCQYYEAPFLINKKKIISIGIRNKERESKYSNMSIQNASDNIISILKSL